MRGWHLILLSVLSVAAACAARGRDAAESTPLLSSVQATTVGDTVRFLLQVTNTTEAPVELRFATGQRYDFVVTRQSREVWRWSADRMFTQALGAQVLQPGETVSHAAEWVPPAGTSGEFVVTGTLSTLEPRVAQSAHFRIP